MIIILIIIESEKKDKYLDLVRELKKLWNMKVTIISIGISVFGTVTKGLLKGVEDLEVGRRVETIETTVLLRTARILRIVQETWEDCCHSDSSEKPSANAGVKNSQKSKIMITGNFLNVLSFISIEICPFVKIFLDISALLFSL